MQELWNLLNNSALVSDPGLWSYLLIALLALLEGPAITLVAATMAGTGSLNPWLVFLAAGAGNFTGDICWYSIGYLGQFETLKRFVPGLGRFEPQIGRLQQDISQNAIKRLLFTKLSLSWAVIPTLVTAGMARVPWISLAPANLLAEVAWTGSLVLAGFYLGSYLTGLQAGLNTLAMVGGVASIVTMGLPVVKFAAAHVFKNHQPILSGDDL
jgi:membrane protein DedA with SNARE-associated domain